MIALRLKLIKMFCNWRLFDWLARCVTWWCWRLQYVDLDEFLSENGMPGEGLGGAHLSSSAFGGGAGLALGLPAPVTKRERSPSPSDCMSPDTINPPLSPADSSKLHHTLLAWHYFHVH